MKLFKSRTLAFLLTIASLSSFKSDAYTINFAEDVDYIQYGLIGQEPNFLMREYGYFRINEFNLHPGQYYLKNNNEQQFGYLFIDDRLPGRIVQIYTPTQGEVAVHFHGNIDDVRIETRSNGNINRLDIQNDQAQFDNEAFDTEILITIAQNQVIIPLFPNAQQILQPIQPIALQEEQIFAPNPFNFAPPALNADQQQANFGDQPPAPALQPFENIYPPLAFPDFLPAPVPIDIFDEILNIRTNIIIFNNNILEINNDDVEGPANYMYRYKLPDDINQRIAENGFFKVALFEDGVLLPQLNCYHGNIENLGNGRTSFFGNGYLYFSTSDNLPLNGKRFTIGTFFVTVPIPQFNLPAFDFNPPAPLVFPEFNADQIVQLEELLRNMRHDENPFDVQQYGVVNPIIANQAPPEIIVQRHELIEQIDANEKGNSEKSMRYRFPERFEKLKEHIDRAKTNLVRSKYPKIEFEGMPFVDEPSLSQTKNARLFSLFIMETKAKIQNVIEGTLNFDLIFNSLAQDDAEMALICLNNLNEYIPNMWLKRQESIDTIREEASFRFPQAFEELISERATDFVVRSYEPFLEFYNRLIHFLRNVIESGQVVSQDAQRFIDEYGYLKLINTDYFGASANECFQKFAGDIHVEELARLINVDQKFLEEVSNELKLALQGKGGWGNNESVMNAAIVAQRFHIPITHFIDQAAGQFGDVLNIFASDVDVLQWLHLDVYSQEINKAFENSRLRNIHQHYSLVEQMTDYEYMLWVTSQVRFCYEKLDQHDLNNEAIELKSILTAYLMEQNRQCGKGMVGRMFIVLNATLSKFGQLIDKLNNQKIRPVVR